jgi:hypothetical protein
LHRQEISKVLRGGRAVKQVFLPLISWSSLASFSSFNWRYDLSMTPSQKIFYLLGAIENFCMTKPVAAARLRLLSLLNVPQSTQGLVSCHDSELFHLPLIFLKLDDLRFPLSHLFLHLL